MIEKLNSSVKSFDLFEGFFDWGGGDFLQSGHSVWSIVLQIKSELIWSELRDNVSKDKLTHQHNTTYHNT